MTELFAMGGYGWYVGMSYGACALAIVAEAIAISTRRRRALRDARLPDDAASAGAVR